MLRLNYPINSIVVVPAPDFNLTTLAMLKLEYDIQDDSQDVYFEMQIERASDAIASYCRRIFALQRYTDTFGGSPWWMWNANGGRCFLANRPVVPGSVVFENGAVVDGDFAIDYEAGIIDLMTWTGAAPSVTYDAGWVLPGWDQPSGGLAGPRLPPAVQSAAIMTVNALRNTGRLSYGGAGEVRSETVEGVGTITYSQVGGSSSSSSSASMMTSGGLPMGVASSLASYVIPVAR